MMLIAGVLFMVLGLASGLLLVLQPFGYAPAAPGITTWVLFPVLTGLGYVFTIIAVRTSAVSLVSRAAGAALLVLAMGATVGLFLTANSIVPATGSPIPLWYVLGLGLVFGSTGLAIRRSASS